jgi:1,5-anhydro-D-fructose reductase (1,5-anhydro-D-mannitol-forming)
MKHSPVRFALLGFGHHAVRRLLPAFAQSKHAALTGLWRRDLTAAAQNAAEYGIEHCFQTREALCASPDVDVVFITSPDAMHGEDTLLALEHGKAVLCEKPLSMNAAEAEEMTKAANAAGLLFGVAQNFRYNQSVRYMREQIAAGLIGEPQLAHAQFVYPGTTAPRRWIADGNLACGGPIGDVGVHCIDALRYVLNGDVTSVTTMARADAMSSGLDAVASLLMEMTGGVYGQVTVSARGQYRTALEIVGSEGVLVAENGLTVDRPVEVIHRKAGALVSTNIFDNADGYMRMLDSFVAALRGEESFAASGEDGLRNMQVLDAAYRSWHSGQREPV